MDIRSNRPGLVSSIWLGVLFSKTRSINDENISDGIQFHQRELQIMFFSKKKKLLASPLGQYSTHLVKREHCKVKYSIQTNNY